MIPAWVLILVIPLTIIVKEILFTFSKRFKTNADQIRAMTDEELAEMFFVLKDNFGCPPSDHDICDYDCKVCLLDWLKQEVQGEVN